jgi:hypothetical protein
MHTLRHYASRLPISALMLPLLLLATSCSRPSLYNENGGVRIFGVIYYIFAILAIIDIFKQPWGLLKKLIWTVIVLVPLGLILYYLVSGRNKNAS